MNKCKLVIIALIVCISSFCLAGCEGNYAKEEKVKDADFTVVGQENIPEQLMEMINDKKEEPFKITYSDKTNLYIVVGYGAQPTSGYSISVKEFYESENNFYLKTLLKGPSKTDVVNQEITYPYIVLMLEDTGKPIRFD